MTSLRSWLASMTIALVCLASTARAADAEPSPLATMSKWSTLPALPGDGPLIVRFAGASGGVLIIGTDKATYALAPDADEWQGAEAFEAPTVREPVAASTDGHGIVVAYEGGAFAVRWTGRGVERLGLPAPPASSWSGTSSAVALGSQVFLQTTDSLLSIDFSDAAPQWRIRATSLGGAERSPASTAVC